MPANSEQRFTIRQLGPDDLDKMDALLDVFGEAFQEENTYCASRPTPDYLKRLLAGEFFVALAASINRKIVGGLAAYVLPKFEQERSEIHIYDLAVAVQYRRQGIATALIQEIRRIAAARDSHVVFIQADYGDAPAIALYSKLGKREDVLHFDLEPIRS